MSNRQFLDPGKSPCVMVLACVMVSAHDMVAPPDDQYLQTMDEASFCGKISTCKWQLGHIIVSWVLMVG